MYQISFLKDILKMSSLQEGKPCQLVIDYVVQFPKWTDNLSCLAFQDLVSLLPNQIILQDFLDTLIWTRRNLINS